MAFIGFIITCLLLLSLFVYYKLTSGDKSSGKRVIVNDPTAQALYQSAKEGEDDKKLSLKEKIELSWQFLYEITETILNKFSAKDKEELKEIGGILVKNGGKYQHVVDSAAIKQALNKTRAINVNQEKKVSKGR